MSADDVEDRLPIVLMTDAEAAVLAAYIAGVEDARAGLPALVDPRHAAHRWDWFAGWNAGCQPRRWP